MKRLSWQMKLGVLLVALTVLLYLCHFFIFRDFHHIAIYLVGDLAFLPLEVLIVTLIIHRVFTSHEKKVLLEKLNMVIGAFWSEVGTELLGLFSRSDANLEVLRKSLLVRKDWSSRDFLDAHARLRDYKPALRERADDLEPLKAFLLARRDFLLRLLENPNLLEHGSFTDLLWAVFHLAEELAHRGSLRDLPATDYEHLEGDVTRVYTRLLSEWLNYMEHLSRAYPYLASLAVRTNPLDPEARVTVT